MGPVLLNLGVGVSASFLDVNFAAFARNAVNSGMTIGRLFVLVGVEEGL